MDSNETNRGNEMETTYELEIWEKAEHWTFYERIQAKDEAEARKKFAKQYGKGYSLRSIHAIR